MLRRRVITGITSLALYGSITASSFAATTYYLDSDGGNDTNSGTSPETAWATLDKATDHTFQPGDQILLQCGDTFTGKLYFHRESGTAADPIIVSSYDTGTKPIIDSKGYKAGIQLFNSSYIEVSGLEITSDGQIPVDGSSKTARYGVFAINNDNGSAHGITLRDLNIHTIYPNEDTPHEGKNATTYLGTAIHIESTSSNPSENLLIEQCQIEDIGWKGVALLYSNSAKVLDNNLTNIGGPGMVPKLCEDLLVQNNIVDHSGAYTDVRMHGRGSGIWPIQCDRVLIEKNTFKHARGRYDSCGAHIDIGNTDVIIQYNVSMDNEGGFVEILGKNNNCAYRYNISINDGSRIKDVNGADGDGHVFLFSGHNSSDVREGPYNSYIYNNTIYIKKEQYGSFGIEGTTEGILVANNLFYIEGSTKDGFLSWWPAYPDGIEDGVVWKNNLYHRVGIFPDDWSFTQTDELYANPTLMNPGGLTAADYVPYSGSIVEGRGIEIPFIPNDSIGLREGLTVTEDFFGTPIQGLPDIGAVEIGGDVSTAIGAAFLEHPRAEGTSSITMTAVNGQENCEYYFSETTGNFGGSDSGWQSDPTYRDDDLLPNTEYEYTVTTRNKDTLSVNTSVVSMATTSIQQPFPNHIIIDEDFSSRPNPSNTASPYPAETWHCNNVSSWSSEIDNNSVATKSDDAMRIGWPYDEVVLNYFTSQSWDLNRDYLLTGDWICATIADKHLGLIVGIGEYDKDTGALKTRIKEITVGNETSPITGETGLFNLSVTSQELQAANVDESNLIGIFFHHDNDGTLKKDSVWSKNDAYSVDNLMMTLSGDDLDLDGDGVPDQTEHAVGLDADNPEDGSTDLDLDGFSNAEEYLMGTAINDPDDTFVFNTAIHSDHAEITLAEKLIMPGRLYIFEYNTSQDSLEPWQTVNVVSGDIAANKGDYTFTDPNPAENAVFNIRVEWEADTITGDRALISLSKGHQLVSFDFVPATLDVKALFQPVLDQIEFIQDQNGSKLYKENGSWKNDIGNWNSNQAYLIKAKSDIEAFAIEKTTISVSPSISLTAGINLIPIRTSSTAGLETMFNSSLDSNIVWIKDVNGNYLRKVNSAWVDQIKETKAGSGLIIKVSGDCSISYKIE